MADLPDPRAPLNRAEILTFGIDAPRHPVTGHVLQRGSGALSVPEQARQHLRTILADHGLAVAREVERKLDEFERNGGGIEMPPLAPSFPYIR
jgi:hypothetical protein